ncbi:hypothetical protein ACWGSK_14055 [Nocardiopsis sp. NPDC055551]|uniref:hypothetical protein n=1 Tax=Nocardiopsis sp. NPDC006832 TaxID=3157188 RepID=UPI0033D64D5D
MSRRTTAVVATALLFLTGCGLAQGTAPAPRVEAGRGVDAEEAAEYMTALVRFSDPEGMREGLTLAEEDSTAHTYLRHYAQVTAAKAEAGELLDNASLEPVPDGFRMCLPGADDCADFTDFTVGEDDLLTGFRIDGQDPGERMVSGHGVAASSAGVDVVLLTAYQTITDDTLVVSAEFTTVDDVDLDLPGATYTAPDGTRSRVAETVGEYSLRAGTATQAVLYFPAAPVGGKLTIGGCLAECSSQVHLDFPVD